MEIDDDAVYSAIRENYDSLGAVRHATTREWVSTATQSPPTQRRSSERKRRHHVRGRASTAWASIDTSLPVFGVRRDSDSLASRSPVRAAAEAACACTCRLRICAEQPAHVLGMAPRMKLRHTCVEMRGAPTTASLVRRSGDLRIVLCAAKVAAGALESR